PVRHELAEETHGLPRWRVAPDSDLLTPAFDRSRDDVVQRGRIDAPLLLIGAGSGPEAAVGDLALVRAREHDDRQLARRRPPAGHRLGTDAVGKREVEQDRVEALREAVDPLAQRPGNGELEARGGGLECALREHGVAVAG